MLRRVRVCKTLVYEIGALCKKKGEQKVEEWEKGVTSKSYGRDGPILPYLRGRYHTNTRENVRLIDRVFSNRFRSQICSLPSRDIIFHTDYLESHLPLGNGPNYLDTKTFQIRVSGRYCLKDEEIQRLISKNSTSTIPRPLCSSIQPTLTIQLYFIRACLMSSWVLGKSSSKLKNYSCYGSRYT